VRPVPSLQPAATARLWRRLVRQPRRVAPAAADCRPLRAVFYAATDWLRLATKLAANPSPCADYWISIPPLAGNKTQPRADQAWRIRALGPNFHALGELNMAAWGAWAAQNGATWYQAGVEARRRLAAAGYDVAAGDSWAVNEFSSAVRRGDGTARADARAFVRGLFDGAGGPAVRGTVFVVGIGQATTDVSAYKARVEGWYEDTPFWTDMQAYVSDWSQEVYGDVRNYAVGDAPLATRRDSLEAYLEHLRALTAVAPDATAAARSYLGDASSPLANAAWQWDSAYGWTAVPVDLMESYVSAQTYALRAFSARTGQPRDHWGFAWQPKNPAGMTADEFATQTGALLDRLAAAIHDSDQTVDPADPGIGACGSPGPVWCGGALAGAWLADAWQAFGSWTPSGLVFTTPPQTLTAGTPSPAMTVQRQILGVGTVTQGGLAVTLSSSSPAGAFSISPSGPWSTTIGVTIPAGSNTSGAFYYEDGQPGSSTISAAAAGEVAGTQVETIVASPPAAQTPPPPTVKVSGIRYVVRATRVLVTLKLRDATGRAVARARVAISLSRNRSRVVTRPRATGTKGTVTFAAPRRAGCFRTKIRNVSARGYAWDAKTPRNRFCLRHS
jgi:hypothetical protein